MNEVKQKRNAKIEIIRILACFAVICYHVRELPWKINGELSETAVFFESLCTICVMTFFLITGFFIYNKKGNIVSDWISLIKKFIFQVFIPFLIVAAVTIVFHDYLISKKTFVECITSFSIVKLLTDLFNTIIHYTVNYLPGTAAHLWYIFSYGIIIFVYPITRYILTKTPKWVTYLILALLTICMIINDYFLFYNNPTYNLIFKIIHKPIYYSACGYVLYNDVIKKYIDAKQPTDALIINKPMFFSSILVYIVTFIALFLTQVNYYLTTNGEYVYTSWLSLYSLVLTIAFVLVVYNINFEKILNEKIENAIYFVANRTLYIYLIHYLIITKFMSIGFQNIFTQNRPNIFYHLAYYIFYSLFIFIVTFAVVLLIETIYKKIKRIFVHAT